jgi:DNA-binding CsgD family transcriptional regulator
MGIWLLQENAGMSYKEARVYLSFMRNESNQQLAETLGVSVRTIQRLHRSAAEKLDGKSLENILAGYMPMVMETAGPDRSPFF